MHSVIEFLWMGMAQCIYYDVERHLDCFQFGAIINEFTVTFIVFILRGLCDCCWFVCFLCSQSCLHLLMLFDFLPCPGITGAWHSGWITFSYVSVNIHFYLFWTNTLKRICVLFVKHIFFIKMCQAVFEVVLLYISTRGSGN